MTEQTKPAPRKRRAPAKKPAPKPEAMIPEESIEVIPGEVIEEEQEARPMQVRVIQRSFDETDVALEHVILGGKEPVVLISFDFKDMFVNLDATKMTLQDLHNLFSTLAEQTKHTPIASTDTPFV